MTVRVGGQAYEFAHIRDLPRCQTCGAAASKQLYSGVNAPMGVYCARHANQALAAFKASA